MITCTKCGATHPDGSKFCDQCGEDLVIKCPSCGATARPTAKFCPKCRTRLDGDSNEGTTFRDNVVDGNVDLSTHTNIITNNYGPSASDLEDAQCNECGEIIPGRLKIYNKCNDCGKYFCSKHLNNQVCLSCERERCLSPFVFERRANNKYSIIRLKNLHEISIDIPSFVESIEDGAFEGSHLIRVTFHDGLIKIGNRAFANCKDIGDISFPTSLCVIGAEAFYGCANLNIEIPHGVRIGTNAFHGTAYDARQKEELRKAEEARRIREAEEKRQAEEARKLREAEERRKAEEARRIREAEERRKFEEARRTREAEERRKAEEARRTREAEEKRKAEEASRPKGWESFSRVFEFEKVAGSNTYKIIKAKNTAITSVKIPDCVSVIGDFAFFFCRSLSTIEIPENVTSIGASALCECSKLTNIKIPNSVTSIGEDAFSCCSSLTSITIPNSVTSIGDATFSFCKNLTNIKIPNSVTRIGACAFFECTRLNTIVFEGTKSEWNAIALGNKWKFNIPATKVICSNGTVQLS